MTNTQATCKKCGGTGYLRVFAHCDGGRCWACQGKADTSYTHTLESNRPTDEEAAARWLATCEERKAARIARRAAR